MATGSVPISVIGKMLYERIRSAGYVPETEPEDAPWGERFFHIRDPSGHELSFAKPLA